MLVKTSTVYESNMIKLKTNSLNINENMNEYLLVMNASWLMVEYIAFVSIAMLAYIVIMLLYVVYRYYFRICMILMLFVECLVGADRVCFAFGARFRAILAVYAR